MNSAPASSSSGLLSSLEPLTARYDCAMLDLDGVVYVGDDAVPEAPAVLAEARARGQALAFVTNNASRTPEEVAARLSGLGVPADPSDVVTSAQAAAHELARRFPAGSRVLVVGGAGLAAALRERDLEPVESSQEEPVAVVQGFGADVGWRELADAAVAIRRGALWVAANTDLTIPTKDGPAPGNGALVNALATAVGAGPAVVAGKPFRPLFDETVERVGSSRPLVVGDRLDTDIAGARRCGADSLLVMTGVTDLRAACGARPAERPGYVAWTLRGLLTSHDAPVHADTGWSLGGWVVRRTNASLEITRSGPDPDSGLRAAVAAAWAALDEEPTLDLRCGSVEEVLGSLR